MFVTRKLKNKNSPIELVTGSEFFFKPQVRKSKAKNKSLIMELVTQSDI